MKSMAWAQRVGVMAAASVLAAMTVASASGCNFLKPKAKKAFTETCSLDTDCESLDCAGQGNICSKPCTYNKDCGGGYVCRQKDDGSGDHCASAVGQLPNGSCMDPGDCENAHCLKRVGEDNAPGICSRFCAGPEDCPDGMKICDVISDTGVLKMCLPGGAGAPVAKFGTVPRKVTTTTKPTATVPPAAPTQGGGSPILARTATPVATAAPTATAKPTATATATAAATGTRVIKPR